MMLDWSSKCVCIVFKCIIFKASSAYSSNSEPEENISVVNQFNCRWHHMIKLFHAFIDLCQYMWHVLSRLSKTFVDTHSVVMHTLQSQKRGLRAEHLGLCKAICTAMGWSHDIEPADGKNYQHCSAEESKSNREDLILWPPAVIVHYVGRKNGGQESVAEILVKDALRDIGLPLERMKIAHGKGGVLVVKYQPLLPCLNDAENLHNHFASKNLGRDEWSSAKSTKQDSDGDGDPMLEDDRGSEKRSLYGYLALAQDLDKVDPDLQRRCQVKSRKDIEALLGDPLAARISED